MKDETESPAGAKTPRAHLHFLAYVYAKHQSDLAWAAWMEAAGMLPDLALASGPPLSPTIVVSAALAESE